MSPAVSTPKRGGGVVVFRERDRGGDHRVVPWVAPTPEAPSMHRRLVLFIHGYNVSHNAACDAFRTMHEMLWAESTQPILEDIFWLFWPGDTAGSKARSSLSYSWQVREVPTIARHLDTWLRELRQNDRGYPEEVVFVAHSLGSRLALETVKLLAEQKAGVPQPPRVSGVILMAAAVPSDYCADPDRFGFELRELLRQTAGPGSLPPREMIMWSGRDPVLRWAFKPGQAAAGENTSQAVGRKGKPPGRWRQLFDAGGGHSDYWSMPEARDRLLTTLYHADMDHELEETELDEWLHPPVVTLDEHRLDTRQINSLCALSRGAYVG